MNNKHYSLLNALVWFANNRPADPAVTLVSDINNLGGAEQLTYRQLLLTAQIQAKHISKTVSAGGTVMLCYPPSIELVVNFYACLLANLVVIPIDYPDSVDNEAQFEHLLIQCYVQHVFVSKNTHSDMQVLLKKKQQKLTSHSRYWSKIARDIQCSVLADIPNIHSGIDDVRGFRFGNSRELAEDLGVNTFDANNASIRYEAALILVNSIASVMKVSVNSQVSSSFVAGQSSVTDNALSANAHNSENSQLLNCIYTHENICQYLTEQSEILALANTDVFVNWPYSSIEVDLLKSIVMPLFVGGHLVLLSPKMAVNQPINWLRCVSYFRGTVCCAPDFAMALALQQISAEEMQSLTLSQWRILLEAANSNNRQVPEHFVSKIAEHGVHVQWRTVATITDYMPYESESLLATDDISGGGAYPEPFIEPVEIPPFADDAIAWIFDSSKAQTVETMPHSSSILEQQGQADLLNSAEAHSVIAQASFASLDSNNQQWLAELFEKRTDLHPNRTAVIFDGETLTYQELNYRSNQVARYLIETGVNYHSTVAVYFQPSIEMYVAILGVIKTGAAYVPLSPNKSAEQIRWIVQDAQVNLLLSHLEATETSALDVNSLYEVSSVILDLPQVEIELQCCARDNLSERTRPRLQPELQTACVFYTYDEQQRATGTRLSHCNLARLATIGVQEVGVLETDTWAFSHDIDQLLALWEFWGALLTGAGGIVVPKWVRKDAHRSAAFIVQNKVSILTITSAQFFKHWLVWQSQGKAANILNVLRTVIFHETHPNTEILAAPIEHFAQQTHCRLIQFYGQLETGLLTFQTSLSIASRATSTAHETLALSEFNHRFIESYLTLLPNIKARITLPSGDLAKLGDDGQVWISGDGVCLGYVSDSATSPSLFIKEDGEPPKTYFATGLTGRLLNDGRILCYLPMPDEQSASS